MSQLGFGNSFGFIGKDYALVATDCAVPRSIITMKSYDDKIQKVADQTLFCLSGDVGDRKNFGEFIGRNLKWYEMRNGRKLDNDGIANFTRSTLAQSIRRNPYMVGVIQAGYEETSGPCMYWFDYFGTMSTPKATAQGLCQYFLLSLFDRHWKAGMSLEEGLTLVELCIEQLSKRYVISLQSFIVKIVDKNGVRQINLNKQVKLEQTKIDMDAPKTATGIPTALKQ
mmetsp:Transcript_14882/g.22451  ORF Transcript_14882/g.22451 Transcript_14882/m.22451 type:complete len:226 (+) Transcript_14882:41-718(+)|eukprot:CAMPEP_0202696944 /NCGR_PEP_ID=MMETSP1385-20130828/10263_1 /ASSEMBLY_ACC=CAM_ASM_000861 /TAXON_ID=933848 /ORGANISM="Elphidium margaritaceum" /LENGTH=225 /DNA_ID=CAMNT_0049353263 /DNA_START=39 /DNA_END=716 /DNA_ORIENTATION=-